MAEFVPPFLRAQWESLSDSSQDVSSAAVFCKLFSVRDECEATVLKLGGMPTDVPIVIDLVARLRSTASSEVRRIASATMPEFSAAVARESTKRHMDLRGLRQAAVEPFRFFVLA